MQLGRVVGHATATIKHASLQGWRLLLVQMITESGKEDGEPVLAIDTLGAGAGSVVVMTSDGAEVRKTVQANDSPIRWLVLGMCDE